MKTMILNVEVDIDDVSVLHMEAIDIDSQKHNIAICRSKVFAKSVTSKSIITIFSNDLKLRGNNWDRTHDLPHIHFGFKYAWMTSFIGASLRSADYKVITKVTREPVTLYTGITY